MTEVKVLKYDYERWSREATLILYKDLIQEDAESLRQLLLDAMRDTDFLKIDLSQVGQVAAPCGDILFTFSNEEKEISKRLLIFRRRRTGSPETDSSLGESGGVK
jgi:ABC-type transporter Mla MlaB component